MLLSSAEWNQELHCMVGVGEPLDHGPYKASETI